MAHAAKRQLRERMLTQIRDMRPSETAMQSVTVMSHLEGFPPYKRARRIGVYLSMSTGEVQTDTIVFQALREGKEVYFPYLHDLNPEDRVYEQQLLQSRQPPGWQPPKSVMDMVRLRDDQDFKDMRAETRGIPVAPPESVPDRQRLFGEIGELRRIPDEDVHLDLILVPGVAFDIDVQTGRIRRCGRGRGYYDYFLRRYEAFKFPGWAVGAVHGPHEEPPVLCGLAFEDQVLTGTEGCSVPTEPHDRTLDTVITGDGRVLGRYRAATS